MAESTQKSKLERLQSGLGFLAVALILVDLSIVAQYSMDLFHMAFQLFHVGLALSVGLGTTPRKASAGVMLYLCALAAVLVQQHETELLNWAWRIFKLGSFFVPMAVCLTGGRKGRRVALGFLVAAVAIGIQLTRTFYPMFVPEDVLPRYRQGPTLLETPAFREQQCKSQPPEAYRYMCEGIEPLPWEEAEALASKAVAEMTMAERHSLMQGVGWKAVIGVPLPLPAVPKRGYYMGNTPPIPRLNIPPLKLHDAGNGFRNNPWPVGAPFTTIMWPSSLAFGATWDVELVERVAAAIGREYRGKGANVILGPSVQVQRVARNGRNFEYMSGEDPYLGARLSEAYVKGVQKEGIIACLKHYAFNEQETFRQGGNFIVDERTAWEIYYPPFEAAVKAGAASVMCSYNRVNGTYACANEELLARDLKRKMGFRGFVMSDWWALQDPPESSVVRGFDQEMPGAGPGTYFNAEALERMEVHKAGNFAGFMGLPRSKVYEDAALRITAAAFKMRLHERPSCTPGADCVAALESDQRSAANSELARTTATRSVVLLKNEGILPIDPEKVKTIALVGVPLNATSMSTQELGMAGDYYSGGGSGHCYVEKETLKTPLLALTERANRAGMRVLSSPTNDVYAASHVVRQADLVIVLTATTAEEGRDRDGLSLDFGADSLVFALAGMKKPLVVLAQVPGTVFMPWRQDVGAIALMFLGGEFTGEAWASVVFGDVSPSGKLPIVLPKGMEGVIEPGGFETTYFEGLFSSYRAKNAAMTSAFPFGHGLSYANFTYAKPTQQRCAAHACVRTSVTNAGGRSASEVAQAYVEFPAEAKEPKLVLRGFHRTAELAVGKEEEVIFSFTERDFSIYAHGGWQLQHGITVHIGSSSADLRHTLVLKD